MLLRSKGRLALIVVVVVMVVAVVEQSWLRSGVTSAFAEFDIYRQPRVCCLFYVVHK
jgi:hypothetical protein